MTRVAVLVALLAGFVLCSPAGAEVLGRRSFGVAVGTTWVDDAAIDRNSLDFSARLRLPVGKNLDIIAFHTQAMLEGDDHAVEGSPRVKQKHTDYGIEFSGHFLPKRTVDPHVRVGVSNASDDTTVDGRPTYADEHLVFRFAGGAELNLTESVSLLFGAAYADSFKDAYGSDLSASLSLNGWLGELILVGLGAEGSFDTGDVSAAVTAAYAF